MLDAYTINGVAKTVLEFGRECLRTDLGPPFVELTILTFTREQPVTAFTRAVSDEGIALEVVAERRRFERSTLSQMRAAVGRRQPDVIWTHGSKSHFLVRFGKLSDGIPWVATHHGYTTSSLLTRLYNQLDRWSLRRPDRVITVCRAFGDDVMRRSGVPADRVRIQHTAIRPGPHAGADDVRRLRAELGWSAQNRVILTVGRLSKEKGQADLLRAFAQLHQRDASLRLMFVGDGPERISLELLTDELKVRDVVRFAGQQADVRPYYAIAGVFALPSESEGSPNVLLEALAAGVPVVASRVGGIPEMVEDGTEALLVPARDVQALGQALQRALTDTELRRKLRDAAPAVVSRHSPEEYFRSIRSILMEVAQHEIAVRPVS